MRPKPKKKRKKRTNEINDTKLLFFEILNIEALGCEEREREREREREWGWAVFNCQIFNLLYLKSQ